MSALRARCPDCRTFTAVAIGPDYQCHRCGREFAAGLVRVPRAWGRGGEAMAEAASLAVPYPETAVVEEATLDDQSAALAHALPERPVVLGGCCCAHVGAVRGLATRDGHHLGLVWIDAHGDLNTPETSPSGNLWGMPLRMLLDDDIVSAENTALVGVRSLDPGESAFLEATGIDDSLDRALANVDSVYVALDLDVLDPSEIDVFVPEPGGPRIGEIEELLRDVSRRASVVGIGVTGLLPVESNLPAVTRLLAAAGF
ncbi:MAG: arginase family protein [Actinobacteria bacterium]|nr:arginase family protein [Actinomycetota bacterium]